MKLAVFLLIAMTILIAGCTQTQTEIADNRSAIIPSQPDSGLMTLPATIEFNMTAKQWEFSPSAIEVYEGQKVILHITNLDVQHGFTITELGVSKELPAKQTTDVEFTASKRGTFTFFCHIFCGEGHSGMNGMITIK